MSESSPPPEPSSLLTDESRAVAGLALAVVGLMGQNALTVGLQFLLIGPAGTPNADWTYGAIVGIGLALPALAALWLTRGTARTATGWPAAVARAAVVVAFVVLAAALLTVVGGVLHPL